MNPDVSKMLADADAWRSRVKAKASVGSWYSVSNAASDRAQIRIYDEISWFGVDAQTFANDLDGITASEIEVAINSPGGSVFDGLAIYNALRTHPARIITRVDGLAASAASFIAQAGDERVMVESSQMMIHDAWGYMAGNAGEFREYADFLEAQTANIAGLYASRSGEFDAEHYSGLMAAETWLSADDAVANGLADRVLVPTRKTSDTQDATRRDVSNQVSTDAPEQSAASVAADESPAADVVHQADSAIAGLLKSLTN